VAEKHDFTGAVRIEVDGTSRRVLKVRFLAKHT